LGTIILTKFGGHQVGGTPQNSFPNETFELLIKISSSQCKKFFVRQLFWPNFEFSRGKFHIN